MFCFKGWWSGGFGYGLWIGILVACGFSVVPVPSMLWKNEFKLSGSSLTKVFFSINALFTFRSLYFIHVFFNYYINCWGRNLYLLHKLSELWSLLSSFKEAFKQKLPINLTFLNNELILLSPCSCKWGSSMVILSVVQVSDVLVDST